jgi:hypothetical protein
MTTKFGLVCATMFQGITMSQGDIYDTKAEADAELKDMRKSRDDADMDEDDDFDVIEIVQKDGKWFDTYGLAIHINEEG